MALQPDDELLKFVSRKHFGLGRHRKCFFTPSMLWQLGKGRHILLEGRNWENSLTPLSHRDREKRTQFMEKFCHLPGPDAHSHRKILEQDLEATH